METPGAGPSRPRLTPPAVEPTTPKSRRRSWFHFGPSSSTPPPPLPTLSSSRRGSKANGGDEGGEELELGAMTPRQSKDTARVPLPSIDRDKEEPELLTIDGELENAKAEQRTLRKKKKRRSKGDGGNEEEGEVLRMMDLKPHGLGPRRPSNSSDTSGRTEVPKGAAYDHGQAFTSRTFSRTASDRLTYSSGASGDLVKLPPRTSSIPLHPPSYPNVKMNRTPSDSSNKDQPPLPSERPLPPLPPERATTPPTAPTGIYVTPSSPTKDTHDRTPNYHSLSAQVSRIHPQPHRERRSSSNDSRPNSRSHGRSGSPIGLGLPTPRSLNPSDLPPPLPAKRQSVSSPMPSRSSSPAQKISFVEPQEVLSDSRGRPTHAEEKRQKVRRARSLSGIFKTSPVMPTPSPNASRAPTPDPIEKHETAKSTGGGVLEWLGVRKTVKRRQSETHLRQKDKVNNQTTSPAEPAQVPRIPSPAPRVSTDSHAHTQGGKSPHGSSGDLTTLDRNRSSQDLERDRGQPSRPSSRTSNSNPHTQPAVATIPTSSSTSSSKLGSLFSRRQTSKRSDGVSPSPPASLPTNSGISPRDSGVASSRSSFSLPPFDPVVSPIYPNSGPWMSSPAADTDNEEMLFSPEGGSNWGPGIRPWMDGTEQQAKVQRSTRSSFSSPPLGSLPEQPISQQNLVAGPAPAKAGQEGRIRSHSDAPQPSAGSIKENRPQSGHGASVHTSSPDPRLAASLHSSPVLAGRPKLGNRANSGNAAIIDRMKTVFARSSSRQRASTLLPERQVHSQYTYTDEFGQLRTSEEWPSNTSSISGTGSSPRPSQGRLSADDPSQPQHSILGLQDAERRRERMSTETDGSNRSSVASSQFGNQSIRLPSNEIRREGTLVSRARPRASTVSVGPTTQAFVPALESPVIYPAAATPPRRRPSAIRKLSNTLLGAGTRSSTSSPKSTSLFPLPPRSSGSVSSSLNNSGFHWDDSSPSGGIGSGATASPRPSMGSLTDPSALLSTSSTSTSGAIALNLKQIAAREGDESPEDYVRRVSLAVPRNEIAGVLATSADEFHLEALRQYMTRFEFLHQPLDVALRQLLMHMSLPKETQQIDRVVEAFAVRYEQCEPDLFGHKDNTYVVAFSMMMLHTDAFNRHNKNKMSKADYVRNTRLDGVSPLVLEAFYDNITFTPFVFIEDDADLLPATNTNATDDSSLALMLPPRSGKIDIYNMIVNKLLHTLRLHIERQIPTQSPYSTSGTADVFDTDDLHVIFSRAHLLKVMLPGKRKTSTGILSSTPSRGAPPVEVVLKIVRAAVLSRMDDSSDHVKKANRKWKPWSVILTASQIMFVKDSVMATTILERTNQATAGRTNQAGPVAISLLPGIPLFKPDEVISLQDCIVVYDRTPSSRSIPATGQTYTFRLVMPHGRQYLLAATDEEEMNSWFSLINYASAFKTAGIRMRGMSMNKEQVVLAGAAAAASHKRDMQVQEHVQGPSRVADAATGTPSIDITTPKKAIFGDSTTISHTETSPLSKSSSEVVRLETTSGGVAVGIDIDAGADEGEQLEEVFDVVKAELAAGRGPGSSKGKSRQRRPPSSATSEKSAASGSGLHQLPVQRRPYGNGTVGDENQNGVQSHLDSKKTAQDARSAACRSHLDRLSALRTEVSTQLSTSLATARNLAILTPFQKTTRDRLSSAVPALATQIRTDRIQIAKYETYISILERDLEKEEQEWATVRHVALQAAAKSLRDPKGVKAIVDDINSPAAKMDLPKLSLPGDEGTDQELPSTSSLTPSPVWSSLPSPTSPGLGHDIFSTPDNSRRPSGAPRPVSASGSHIFPESRPHPRRSSSSASAAAERQDISSGSNTNGTSTPMIFNLSENEDETAAEVDVVRRGTLKANASKRPSRMSSDASIGKTGRGDRSPVRYKKEREITAIFIGREPAGGQKGNSEGKA